MIQLNSMFLFGTLFTSAVFGWCNFSQKIQLAKVRVKEEWFIQKLDNFNRNDMPSWEQRYFVNVQYYKRGGPVFLMVGGAEEAAVGWMTKGTWIDYAKRFGALCFMLEHRFYGQSRPTEDTSDLQYLTVEQALSDLATFIAAMNIKYKLEANNRWIVFGGSYPGMLAAWLRLKYSHLVYGVVSSSSILLPTMDYSGYFQVIAEVLKAYNDECEKAIKDGTLEVNDLIQQNNKGQILTEKFNLCDPEDVSLDEKDIANLNRRLAYNFGFIQLYKEDWSFVRGGTGTSKITVEMVCDIMTNNDQKSAMERLADVNSLMLRANRLKCLDYKYKNLIKVARNTSWHDGNIDDRRWWHLLCTGFATFPTSSFELGTFGDKFPVEFYIHACMDVFGPKYNASYIRERIKMKKIEYGGLNINITNTVFVHGSIDPWHLAGVLKSVTNGPSVIYIDGTAHVADMLPETKNDLPELKAARKQIAELINKWLHQ